MDQLEQQFNRLNLSRRDFSEALEYLDEIKSAEPSIVRRALLSMAIVAYARPFGNNRGAGKASRSIDPPLDELLSADGQELHDQILTLRDKGVAHSDYELKPTRRIPTPDIGGMLSQSKPFDPQSEIRSVATFRNAASTLEGWCTTQCINLARELDRRSPPS